MKPEISIVIPCLNESETLAKVINNALIGGRKTGKEFEIILADNGSTDGSIDIASQLGIKIVEIKTKGYGAAINGGVNAAIGDVILLADADDSYELENLDKFTNKIESGFDLVIGNRFQGGVQKGAMPFLHKYLGNPVLSLIGRILFKITIHDFHCGMRAFRKSKYEQIQVLSSGMEFATEIIARFAQANFAIAEIPTILRKDGRSRKPHLRTWRDGWRHLRFILVNSPSWLFYFPGLFLTLIGVSFNVINIFGTIQIFGRKVETVGTVIACLITIVGVQFLWFEIIMKKASIIIGLGAKKSLPSKWKFSNITLEFIIIISVAIELLMIIWFIYLFMKWNNGTIDAEGMLMRVKLSVIFLTVTVINVLAISSSFVIFFLDSSKKVAKTK